jgi:hypothetical protein
MSLFLVSTQFGDEAHLAIREKHMFTEVGLPWELELFPKDLELLGTVRFVKRDTESSAPSYCTLTIHMDSELPIKSFLMLVNIRQLENFCRWLAVNEIECPTFYRNYEHTFQYHQAQLSITKKAR